jgi:hypothetical protein
MINLETIIMQEIKLTTLYDGINAARERNIVRGWLNQEMMAVCEEWWAITKDAQALFDLYKIYSESNTRKVIRKTLILECVIVVSSAFFIQQEQFPLNDADQKYVQKRLIRLFYLAHQNLMHIICLVL